MITLGFWFLEELRPFIGKNCPQLNLVGLDNITYSVKISHNRLECFKRNPICVRCKRTGIVWRLQSHTGEAPHISLFSIEKDNSLIEMTQDHILPRCFGGPNELWNIQTLCFKCNQVKGSGILNDRDIDFANLAGRSSYKQRLLALSTYADYLASFNRFSA